MDHASTAESLIARNVFGLPATDREWPFPPGSAQWAASPDLERAALDLLAATARAWGLGGRGSPTRQAS
ncbi:MAG TPA: hypothetical protein VJM14_07535 [Burkholderiales bacterium]|nr:hypothetical protein [Burkholderiales bacterium]